MAGLLERMETAKLYLDTKRPPLPRSVYRGNSRLLLLLLNPGDKWALVLADLLRDRIYIHEARPHNKAQKEIRDWMEVIQLVTFHYPDRDWPYTTVVTATPYRENRYTRLAYWEVPSNGL